MAAATLIATSKLVTGRSSLDFAHAMRLARPDHLLGVYAVAVHDLAVEQVRHDREADVGCGRASMRCGMPQRGTSTAPVMRSSGAMVKDGAAAQPCAFLP
jgi:hypothetical protein